MQAGETKAATGDFDPIPRERAADQVRKWIRQGRLPRGRRLPSERELASRLEVGRMVVRGVLADLEAAGLVRCEARRAWFVADGASALRPSFVEEAIAVITESVPEVPEQVAPGWFGQIYRGVIQAGLEAQHHVLTVACDRLANGRVQAFVDESPVGAILLGAQAQLLSRHDVLEALHLGDIPVAAYADIHDWPTCDVVVSDHAAGAEALVGWLAGQGCKRLLQCGHPTDSHLDWLAQRQAGYERGCKAAGLATLQPIPMANIPDWDGSREVFERTAHLYAGYLYPYLHGNEPVDALLVTSDGLVPQFAAACRILDKVPGTDVLIVGYDNYWRDIQERRWEPCPPAATVDKDNFAIGKALVELLLDRLAGRLPEERQRRVIPPRLMISASDPSTARPHD